MNSYIFEYINSLSQRQLLLACASILGIMFIGCKDKTAGIKPEYRDITETVFASGSLSPENQFNLVAQTDGFLTAFKYKEGDDIKSGEIVAYITNDANNINDLSAAKLTEIARNNTNANAPALLQIQANINAAEEKLRQATTNANRYQVLLEQNSVSRLEYENAKLEQQTASENLAALKANYNQIKQNAEQQLVVQESQKDLAGFNRKMNALTSIIAGKILSRNKQSGDYVRKGEVIAVIGNINSLYARLNVDENSIEKVKTGQTAVIQLNTNSKKTYNTKIVQVLPAFEMSSQSFICKAVFTDNLPFAVSGTQLQANIIIGERKNVLVIPRKMLQYGNKVTVKGKGQIKIATGIVSTDWVEVLDGLDANSELLDNTPK